MLGSNERPQAKLNTSVVIAPRSYSYGTIIGIEEFAHRAATRKDSFKDLIKFYFTEYITGVLFVTALTAYMVLSQVMEYNWRASVYAWVSRAFKKSLDMVVAVLLLIVTAPLFLIIPILIKLDSPGPVFYIQERIGLNRRKRNRRSHAVVARREFRGRERRREDNLGRPFRVIKFRTMVNNAEAKTGAVWAIKNDTRITRLGRFLRKTRIDELPQLINVLKGEMAMVGPRPERPVFVKDLSVKVPNYVERLKVKPGITGRSQVDNGYDSSIESVVKKVEYDVDYIRNWNFWSDIKILMKTVLVVITGKGAC